MFASSTSESLGAAPNQILLHLAPHLFSALVEATVEPHVSEEKRLEIEGEDVAIARIQVTPLGLVLHELATNAVKYGCWSNEGLLTVRWREQSDLLHLEWQEERDGSIDEEERESEARTEVGGGFGSTLMTGAGRQLGGEVERTFGPRGVTVRVAREDGLPAVKHTEYAYKSLKRYK